MTALGDARAAVDGIRAGEAAVVAALSLLSIAESLDAIAAHGHTFDRFPGGTALMPCACGEPAPG